MSKVTICIPTYNRAAFLKEAVQSVINQSFKDIEILISDNASTDETPSVMAGFSDPRIRYHRHPQNIGMGANHRYCAEITQSELIGFLSDDDLFTPTHVEDALIALERFPSSVYYACAIEMFGNGTTGIRHPEALKESSQSLAFYEPSKAVNFLGLENPGFLNTIICRKSAFNSNIFWGKSDFVHMDVLVMTQLMVQGGFLYDCKPTVRYRSHTSNISNQPYNQRHNLKLACMISYAIRYLAQFLLDKEIASLNDIRMHGQNTTSHSCVRKLVFGLGSYDSSPQLQKLAREIFFLRSDLGESDSKFGVVLRLARKLGFPIIPSFERLAQFAVNWRP